MPASPAPKSSWRSTISPAECYLVNLQYVKAVENDFVHVNTDHLEISRRQRAAFLTAVASYIGGVL